MNVRKALSVGVAASSLLLGCAPASSPETNESDVQALRDMSPRFLAAFNAGESTVDMFTEDAVRIPPQGPALVGHEALRERDLAYHAEFTATQTATTDEVQVYGDVGFARGTWSVRETPRAGGAEVERNGNWLIIYERQPNGQWKAIRHIWNQAP